MVRCVELLSCRYMYCTSTSTSYTTWRQLFVSSAGLFFQKISSTRDTVRCFGWGAADLCGHPQYVVSGTIGDITAGLRIGCCAPASITHVLHRRVWYAGSPPGHPVRFKNTRAMGEVCETPCHGEVLGDFVRDYRSHYVGCEPGGWSRQVGRAVCTYYLCMSCLQQCTYSCRRSQAVRSNVRRQSKVPSTCTVVVAQHPFRSTLAL